MIVETIEQEYLKSPDEFHVTALNQTITDREIFNTILAGLFTTKKWASAIKIGDVWLSIPAKHIAVYDPSDERWKSYKDTPNQILQMLEYPGEVSIDPMEKFIHFTTHLENNVQIGANINRPSGLTVMNDKPVDKVFNLVFECTAQSIQNNIRPLIAQFTVSPFLPVHNIDLNRIVNPADENPDPFLALGKAHIGRSGKFRFGPPELSGIFSDNVGDSSAYFRDETLDGMDPTEPEKQLFERIRMASLQEFEQAEIRDIRTFLLWLENRAYLEVPFYVQLIDYHLETIENKANAVRVTLVVRAIDTESAYGMIPLFIKTEDALNRHISYQNWLKQIAKGDDNVIRKIAKAFKINSYGQDYPLELGGNYTLSLSMRHQFPSLKIEDNHFCGAIQLLDNSILLLNDINHPGDRNIRPSRSYGPTVPDDSIPNSEDTYTSLKLKFDKYSHPAVTNTNKLNTEINITPKNVTSPNNLLLANSKNGVLVVENTVNTLKEDDPLKENYTVMQYNLKNFMSSHDPLLVNSQDTLTTYDPDNEGYDYNEINRLNTITSAIISMGLPDIMVFEELGADEISAKGKPALIERMAEIFNKHPAAGGRTFVAGKFNNIYGDGEYRQGIGYITSLPIYGIPKAHHINDIYKELENVDLELRQSDASVGEVLGKSRHILQFELMRENGNYITLFACHFRSRIDIANHYVRVIESKCLMHLIDALPDDRPFIVCGDFNHTWFKDNTRPGIELPGLLDYSLQPSNKKSENNKIIPEIRKVESEFRLDIPVCFQPDLMRQIANDEVDIGEIPKKHILFNSLGKRYYHFLLSENEESKKHIGTFFNEKKTQTGAIDTKGGNWSLLDYVFYSYHFFSTNSHVQFDDAQIVKAVNIKEIGRYIYDEAKGYGEYIFDKPPEDGILSNLNQQWVKSVDRRLAERVGEDIIEPAIFSDHYPVLSSFKWKELPDVDDRQKVETSESILMDAVTGKETETGFRKFEIFGAAVVDKIAVVSEDNNVTDKILKYTAYGIIGQYASAITVVVESIYYSKLIGNYVINGYFLLGNDKTDFLKEIGLNAAYRTLEEQLDSAANTPLLARSVPYKSGDIIGFSIPFQASTVEDFENALSRYLEDNDTPDPENINTLMKMVIRAINADSKRSPNDTSSRKYYKIYSSLPGIITLYIDDEEDEETTGSGKYSPSSVARVFKKRPVAGPQDLNVDNVSINISKCQPFRNHYLPLLEEFEESVQHFKWQYTFRLDSMKAYTRTPYTFNEDQNNFSLSFYKKVVGKFKKNYAARLQEALAVIGGIGAGSSLDQITNLGKLAMDMLTSSSRRLASIIRNQRAVNPSLSMNHIASDIFTGEPRPYCAKNTLMNEILLYIIANINIVLFFLEDDEFYKVLNHKTFPYDENSLSYIFYGIDDDQRANKDMLLVESYSIAAHRLGIADEESQDNRLYERILKYRKTIGSHIESQRATIQAINQKTDTRDSTEDIDRLNKLYENSFNLTFLKAGNKEFNMKSLIQFLKNSRARLLNIASELTTKDAKSITFTIS